MSDPTVPCRICRSQVAATTVSGSATPRFQCRTCGDYELSEAAARQLYELTGGPPAAGIRIDQHHLVSAVIRERFEASGQTVRIDDLDEVFAAARPLPGGYIEAVDRVLLYVSRRLPRLGSAARLWARADYPIAYSIDDGEFTATVVLAHELGYLGYKDDGSGVLSATVTADGWKRVQQLRAHEVEHRIAFVAMSFSEALIPVYRDGIAPALRANGYQPFRVDRVEHNEKIDDRIIAGIRGSGLLVADFTV